MPRPSDAAREDGTSRPPGRDQSGFAATGGGTLWGLPNGGTPSVGDTSPPSPRPPQLRRLRRRDYLPVGVEVRFASRNEIDLNANTCAQLLAMQYADCFRRLSQIRVWNDGNADNQVRIGDVHLTGAAATLRLITSGRCRSAATDCRYGAKV